jgi:uncharacterized protein YjbI with pentapeptide repeats
MPKAFFVLYFFVYGMVAAHYSGRDNAMANEEQVALLKQDANLWNTWREQHPQVAINLISADLRKDDLREANLCEASLMGAGLDGANLQGADLSKANLVRANLSAAKLHRSNFWKAEAGLTIFGQSDLSETMGLEDVVHKGPSIISTDTFVLSKGKISEAFLRGCGLSDWEIEHVKLYNPDLRYDEIIQTEYKVFDLRTSQALQISPLFLSCSLADSEFVDKLENQLNGKGIRYWPDVHDRKAGRLETQIDLSIDQNPRLLLILSSNSIKSDLVEHEFRAARELEKDLGRGVLCPVALDDSWKSSPWPEWVMDQIMEYNILDFSDWKDDAKFTDMFRELLNELDLF